MSQIPEIKPGQSVELLWITCGQPIQFGVQLLQQGIQMLGVADDETHLMVDVHRFGERAQVEADNGLFHPLAGDGDDFFVGHAAAFSARA